MQTFVSCRPVCLAGFCVVQVSVLYRPLYHTGLLEFAVYVSSNVQLYQRLIVVGLVNVLQSGSVGFVHDGDPRKPVNIAYRICSLVFRHRV
jgi:hypothetical protein